MRIVFPVICLLILASIVSGCGRSADKIDEHDHPEESGGLAEGALYDEVMKLHDEGMEKMDEIHALKQQLKQEIEGTPGMVEAKRTEIESKISQLDSAGRAMMVWMRNFHPETDTLDASGYRNYLESELKKVKKVRDDIFAAVERAKEE